MFADLDFCDIHFKKFDPTASAYGWRLKFVRAEHSATAEGEKCGYSPTLGSTYNRFSKKMPNLPRQIY